MKEKFKKNTAKKNVDGFRIDALKHLAEGTVDLLIINNRIYKLS
jgi:glycosidase